MSDAAKGPATKGKKDRSPSFPFIPLGTAVDRLVAFDAKFGRHPTPADKAGLAWGIKEGSSQADQTLAALRSFGLVIYNGMGPKRDVSISGEGRTYLRAEQESTKATVIKSAALRPRIIRKLWLTWREDRPIDAIALEKLKFEYKFSDSGAPSFLKIYDATVAFAKLSKADKIPDEADADSEEQGNELGENGGKLENLRNPPPPQVQQKRREVKVGMKEDVFTLTEGDVTLQWPEALSVESFQDLEDWTKLILRKIKRAIDEESTRRARESSNPPT